MKVFAIIPARGGSKGIPGKNLKKVAGRPLVARTIQAALAAKSISRVFVSTDGDDISVCAREAGAEVIVRPAEISGDAASSEAALLHACDFWESEDDLPDVIVFLQTTSCFTTARDIDGAVKKLQDADADVVLGVAQHHRFQWAEADDGSLSAVGHDMFNRPRRQELKNRYVETGAMYLMKTDGFRKSRFRFFGKVVGYELSEDSMFEIDSQRDLLVARALAPFLDEVEVTIPQPVGAVVFDFDGVMTDDAVYLSQEGVETVRASRRDGMGISLLKKQGIAVLVLSKERNPVVKRRCEKLEIECLHGIDDKLPTLDIWLSEKGISRKNTVYVGNDVNDIECLEACGLGVAVADADARAIAASDWVTTVRGGNGAVREICELLTRKKS